MRLLVLGGTQFLGRYIVEHALEQGYSVSVFNRGQTNQHLWEGRDVEQLHGDRDGNLESLAGSDWDVVVDTCGYLPRIVDASAKLLSDGVGHYAYVSSVSVYGDLSQPLTEESVIAQLDDETTEELDRETYGPLKALCEQRVRHSFPDRNLIVRPGLLVGPHDPTDRFTAWPLRFALGDKQILCPSAPDISVQFIDVRDVARWIVDASAGGVVGTFNANGPEVPMSIKEFFESCAHVAGIEPELVWADEDFLLANEVRPFVDMPLWVPRKDKGITMIDSSRALQKGLTLRPVSETIRDTLEWAQENREPTELRAGLSRDREAELLALQRNCE